MKIGLYAPDSKIPNFALMKVSAFHKNLGDPVSWYSDMWSDNFDMVYCSKIFTFTPMPNMLNNNCFCGGTGFDIKDKLPKAIEYVEPDYKLYPELKTAIGFLTRGCIRRCKECFVPEKEGDIKPYRDIEQVLQGRSTVVLMDNNVLASEHGIKQIEKIIKLKVKVDFNQGLDCRLIDNTMAKLLSRVKWLAPLRMACDNMSMIGPVRKATELLRWHNCQPVKYSVYVLIKEIETAIERLRFLKGMHLDPFVQPYINKAGDEPAKKLKKLARWVNKKQIFRSTPWETYK